MTTERHLERDLPFILGDLAMGPYPDYIDDVLATTAQRRQRPAWTFPERWLLMDIATQRVAAPRLPWRQLGILTIIAALIATAAAIFVASQPRLPAPFGLAANGLIADAVDGDIRTIDPDTGSINVIVDGPAADALPWFSRDGTWLVFLRAPTADGLDTPRLYAVRPDGSGLTLLTPDPLVDLAWYEFTVDNAAVIIQSRIEGKMRISLAATDGSGLRTFEDIGVANDGGLALRPPDGREVLFKTLSAFDGTFGGIAALDLETGSVHTVIAGLPDTGIFSNIVWSPAGDRFAYARFYRRANIEVRVANADGSNDHVVGHQDGASFVGWPQWSPSGRYLLLERGFGSDAVDAHEATPVVIDLNTGVEVVIRTTISLRDAAKEHPAKEHRGAAKEWAPDESAILAIRTDENDVDSRQELWDITTGEVTVAPWNSTTPPTWQRIAP